MCIFRVVLVGLLFTACVSCNSNSNEQPQANVDPAVEAAHLMTLETDWSDMSVAGDLEGIAALLSKDAIVIAPGEAPIVGFNDVRASIQASIAAGSEGTSWRSTAAFVAPSGDMAYDYGTTATKMPDGSIAAGNYLVVWVKENGQWNIAADIFN